MTLTARSTRIYALLFDPVQSQASSAASWPSECEQASVLGFDSILAMAYQPPQPGVYAAGNRALDEWDPATLSALIAAARKHGLQLLIDISFEHANASDLASRLIGYCDVGVDGFRVVFPHGLSDNDSRASIAAVRQAHPASRFLAWTPGLAPDAIGRLAGVGYEATFCSIPWWDGRDSWLLDEVARLLPVAPVISPIIPVGGQSMATDNANGEAAIPPAHLALLRARLLASTIVGSGLLIDARWARHSSLRDIVRETNRIASATPLPAGRPMMLQGYGHTPVVLFRGDGMAFADPALPNANGRLVLINAGADLAAPVDWPTVAARLPHGYGLPARSELPARLAAGDSLLLNITRDRPIAPKQAPSLDAARGAARIAIESVSPSVDAGRFPLKRVVGEPITVSADVFMDGHDHLAVQLRWRAIDEQQWHEVPMRHLGNDRWEGRFSASRLGRHEYTVRAWRDTWASYRDELSKKNAAGLDLTLEAAEGRLLIAAALASACDSARTVLTALQDIVQAPSQSLPPVTAEQIEHLLSEPTAGAMREAAAHDFETQADTAYPVTVERQGARFASWYELFPRSQSGSAGRHGTFTDVIARLPAIRDMGFDVLYFPPIHPIGRRNRKGKNNSLNAGADQPGSPYAIGSEEGGHDALHPELGSFAEFKELLQAAHRHGLEIALDFAIQCSPDHPWLTQHHEWFSWRPDGSMRYAENPPKRYEDIVNVDFFGPDGKGQADLWRALRDVVLFWADLGVRTFRVDNPHTKPLPFWEWMIADIQARRPDVLFLAEAFTRPKMMYRLAKCGFSQSYTYFTWRDTKQELIEYLTELNLPGPASVFRPNFFVNTPDINPRFLQQSGRAGFLIRLALATTLSGLWGMYSGFELCDAQPIPGKEEYLNSEKYEVRAWDWQQPGNIIAEMTALNRIRQANPALQTHLGFRVQQVANDRILMFTKETPERDNVILVAVNLDPYAAQAGGFELPLWEFGLPDDGMLDAHDLISGSRQQWRGKFRHIALTPERPYEVWRLSRPS